ncbi:MAG: glycosyltransferase, partial [Gammaproteobacteria bacterium]
DNPAAIAQIELESRLAPGIEWWGAQTEMRSVYQRAALVCLPSYREGLPKVLLEAAACGRALVATDVPGCREICRDHITGLLVPSRDPAALARAISTLLGDPVRRRELGAAARRVVEAEFSIERIAAETLEFYASLTAHAVGAGIEPE